jgi:hypothetical protein
MTKIRTKRRFLSLVLVLVLGFRDIAIGQNWIFVGREQGRVRGQNPNVKLGIGNWDFICHLFIGI